MSNRKYARDEDCKAIKEDVKAFKECFFKFLDNDFKHVQLDIARLEGGRKFERAMLIAVLSVMLSLFVANIFGFNIGV